MVASVTDLFAYGFSGFVYKTLGMKGSFILCFGMSTLGGLLTLFWGLDHQTSSMFLVLVLLCRAGISSSLNIVYIAHTSVFPTLFASTSIGFCGFLAKTFTTVSPVLAQMEEPGPMIAFTVTACLSGLLTFGLQLDKKTQETQKK